jgi:DNA-binding transcriptional MerR regulator
LTVPPPSGSEGLTVKQVAERVGLPSRTIRYYDRIGLVTAGERTASGYRLYGPREEGQLRFVGRAKALGFSLHDIRGLLDAAERGCCGEVMPELDRLLEDKLKQIDERIADLTAFRDRLESYAAGKRSGCGHPDHGAFCGCLDDVPAANGAP